MVASAVSLQSVLNDGADDDFRDHTESIENVRVVVTGLGLVTPGGKLCRRHWFAVGRGRVASILSRSSTRKNSRLNLQRKSKDFDPLNMSRKKEARKRAAFIHYAIARRTMQEVAACNRRKNGRAGWNLHQQWHR